MIDKESAPFGALSLCVFVQHEHTLKGASPDSGAQREILVDKKYNFTEICYDVRRKRFNLHKSR